MEQGKITGIEYQGGSGLAVVVLTNGTQTKRLGVDASTAFRSFEAAFSSVEDAIGKEIEYEETSYGTMSGFNVPGESDD